MDASFPPAVDSPADAPSADVRARPHQRRELLTALLRPDRLAEIVLGEPERLAASAAAGRELGPLLLLLVATSALFAVPIACVHSLPGFWKVALLFLGSTLLCVPALLVFAAYLGLRLRIAPLLVPALAIPAVAALFSFGFAPILAFLRATMDDGDGLGWRELSALLLMVAVAAGIGQLWRCLAATPGEVRRGGFRCLVAVWLAVFLHVAWRMARLLEIA